MTQTKTISSESELQTLVESWDELVRSMRRPSPFLLHGWLVEWWRHYGAGERLAVHVAFRGNRLVGALPLCIRRRFGLDVMEFVGGSRGPLADLMLAGGENGSTAADLLDLAEASDHDFADLFGMPGDSRLVDSLPSGALRLVQRLEAPVLDLSPGWDAVYQAKLSSKARATRRTRLRQLAKLGSVELSVARTRAELERTLEDAFRLHALRWKGHRETSGFSTPTGRQFHRAALLRLADQNVPRLFTVSLDGQAIAYNLCLQLDRSSYGLTMAFDPAFKRFAPGTEALLSTLEAAAGEGIERVEFLGAVAPYKQRLADRMEPLYQGLGLASTLRGRAAVEALVGGIRLRRQLKRSQTAQKLYDRVPRRR